MRKPNLTLKCVANNYAADGERIAEFSFPAAHDGRGALPGGLISFRYREGAPPLVSIYRAEGVEIAGDGGDAGVGANALRQVVEAAAAFVEAMPAPSSRKGSDALRAFYDLLDALPCRLGGRHVWGPGDDCTKCGALPPVVEDAKDRAEAAGYEVVESGPGVFAFNRPNGDGCASGYRSAAAAWIAATADQKGRARSEGPKVGYGITAHRSAASSLGAQSLAVTVDGVPQLFPTLEAARAEADRLNAATTSHAVHYTANLEPQEIAR